MAHVLQSAKEPELNYFICTLGQAVKINAQGPHVFKTVNDLIDCQARTIPQAPAVGFPVPPDSENNGPEWQQRFLSMLVSSRRGLGIRNLICALLSVRGSTARINRDRAIFVKVTAGVYDTYQDCSTTMPKLHRLPFRMARSDEVGAFGPSHRVRITLTGCAEVKSELNPRW